MESSDQTKTTGGSAGTFGAAGLEVSDGSASAVARPDRPVLLGRDPTCQLIIDDRRVSRHHAEVSWMDDAWVLRDMASTNGTFVAGARVDQVTLDEHSEVRLGGADGPLLLFAHVADDDSGEAEAELEPEPEREPETAPVLRLDDLFPVEEPVEEPPDPEATTRQPTVTQTPPPSRPSPLAAPTAMQPVVQPTVPASPGPGRTAVAPARAGTTRRAPTARVRIGRAPDNDIVLDHVLVSRHHAELREVNGTYLVVDMGSRTGTYHNGRKVPRGLLKPGDLISIGRHEFVFDGSQLHEFVDRGPASLAADDLSVQIRDKVLLDDVSFALTEGSLLALIGPSGCGKSTLLRALTGIRRATQGTVRYDGRDLYTDYAELRYRIGMVPQDDVLHRQLTVRRALRFAAALRFADDVPRRERIARVDEVIDMLGLTERAKARIDTLSGGQRKRASVAMELLTEPSLLCLDEPTSGLDPALDKEVMEELRELADRGRTVIVVTHNVLHLDMCDRVMVLCQGGRLGYFGPPEGVLEFFEAPDYADVFSKVTDDADRWAHKFRVSDAYARYVMEPMIPPAVTPAVAAAPAKAGSASAPAQRSAPERVLAVAVRDAIQSVRAHQQAGASPSAEAAQPAASQPAASQPAASGLASGEPITADMQTADLGTQPPATATRAGTVVTGGSLAETAGAAASSALASASSVANELSSRLFGRQLFSTGGSGNGANAAVFKRRRLHPTAPLRQFATLCARMVSVTISDRGYALFLLGLPLALALLSRSVPGTTGLGPPPPGQFGLEAQRILVVLVLGAAFMGIAPAIREIVSESSIYRRERAIGLSPLAYLCSKIVVFSFINIIQVYIYVKLSMWGRPGPASSLVFTAPMTEIIVPVALVAISCTSLGLCISALVRTTEQTTPVLVVAVMAELVLSGGLFELQGQKTLQIISWIAQARWGFAAGASTVDLQSMIPFKDALWDPTTDAWWGAILVLGVHIVVLAALARLVLVRFEPGRD